MIGWLSQFFFIYKEAEVERAIPTTLVSIWLTMAAIVVLEPFLGGMRIDVFGMLLIVVFYLLVTSVTLIINITLIEYCIRTYERLTGEKYVKAVCES